MKKVILFAAFAVIALSSCGKKEEAPVVDSAAIDSTAVVVDTTAVDTTAAVADSAAVVA